MPEPKTLPPLNQAIEPAWYGYDTEPRSVRRPALPLSLDPPPPPLEDPRLRIAPRVAATLIVSSRLTPIYESTATVDIDRQMPTGIIGQEATRQPRTTPTSSSPPRSSSSSPIPCSAPWPTNTTCWIETRTRQCRHFRARWS